MAGAWVGLVLIGAAIWFVPSPYWSHGCGGMFSGMSRTSTRECVGVIDNAGLLDSSLQGVFDSIQHENQEAARSAGPYVKVVLLTPLTKSATSSSSMDLDQIKFSLEGAYLALHRANNGQDFGSPSAVKIQMLVANQGSHQEFEPRIITDIVHRGEADHPVVAVVGLGNSFRGTEQTASALAAAGIPMVSAVASADGLTSSKFPGLRSVAPSNIAYANALGELLDNQPSLGLKTGIIVADQNDDPYTRSLAAAFSTRLGRYANKYPPQPFSGSTTNSDAAPGVFDSIVQNICLAATSATGLDMVFFAGRVKDFKFFVEAMSSQNRTCDKPLVVLCGATGFQTANRYVDRIKDAKLTVIYSSSTDAEAWGAGRSDPPAGFASFMKEFADRGFPSDDLSDGYVIMYHDAMASAVSAIRLAARGRPVPKTADVASAFNILNLTNVVHAASGTLTFSATPTGRAVNKPVVYRQIAPTAAVQLPSNLKPYLTPSA